MIKFEYIQIPVTWSFDDLSTIQTYGNVGWRFVGYSPIAPYVAYFERKSKVVYGGDR